MNKHRHPLELRNLRKLAGHLAAILAIASSSTAFAALTDISSAPLTGTTSAQVKPNIMLLMDTSGSMGWGHMPDEVETATGIGSVGYKAAQCNVLYYNRSQTYTIPKKPDGTPFATPSFTNAPYAGYVSYYASPTTTDQSAVNLSTSFKAYDDFTLRTSGSNDTPQAAYYYYYTGSQTLGYATAPCTDVDTNASKSATGGGTWTRVVVSSSSGPGATDERANFAIWYSYYRTRISLTKSAASLAFTPLTDSFRVGFITVQPKDTPASTSINASKYLAINDFNSTQRGLWFDKLFSQSPGGASPAREGLARVGRHYAGKQDGINSGMTGDPVQYACQQNFTIMTTDGYWNDQTESPGGGPVKIDGTTLVGQQDGTLTLDTGLSPRPIWDGFADSTTVVTDKVNTFSYGACGTFANMTTVQILQSTSQINVTTTQQFQVTTQALQSTTQRLKSTSQLTQSTTQSTQSTLQATQSTRQNLQSTVQNLQTTTQLRQTTTQNLQTVQIPRQSTTQNLQSTSQLQQTTAQVQQSTSQATKSTSQILKSTAQNLQSTTQLQASTSQAVQSTSQASRSTSQLTASTLQLSKSTSQIKSCDASTELCTPVASCTPGGLITCQTATTGPTFVASCTPATANAGNSYTSTTCASNSTGPTPTGSCTTAAATSANNYTSTTCNTVTTGPTLVASCTPATASSSNSYTATTCSTTTTGPTPVATCTPVAASSGNNYTATTCGTNTTGPTAVQTCTATAASSGNNYTATTCGNNNTTNVAVGSCSPSSASSSNSWTTTTCSTNNTSNVPAASCTAASASSSNSWTTTTCPAPITTGPTAVASCTAVAPSSGNSFTRTTCGSNTTGPTAVASCTAVAASSANNYTATTCANNNTGPTGVASCTAALPTSGNSYTTTSCNTVTSGPTAVASCTPATAGSGNSYTATTCSTNNTTNQAVASCTASGPTAANGYTTTTCPAPTIVSGPTPVATCTASAATAANGYQQTVCTVATATNPVATCTPSGPTAANGYTTTTCNTVTVGPTPVATCTASGPTAANGYTTTTCPTPNTTTNVPVATCTAAAAAAGNNYTTTTCPAAITSGPTPVASCTAVAAAAGNNYTAILCGSNSTGPTAVASCTPVTAAAGNNYTATTCGTNTTGPTGVASCTAVAPTAANGYTTTSCNTLTSGPTAVASCTNAAAASGNSYTATTCTDNNTTNVPVASCTAAPPSAANNYTRTTCPTPITTNTAVQTCTPVAASAANSWTATTCPAPTVTTTPAGSCTPVAASAANGWTATTCPAPTVTNNVPVASCTSGTANAGNAWTNTSCVTNTSTPTLTSTCVATPASSANNYTSTVCVAVPGRKIQYATTTTVTTTNSSGGFVVGTPTVTTNTGSTTDLDGVCYADGTQPALPSPNPQKAGIAAGPNPPTGCAGWPCSVTTTNTGGSTNALADVAQYYYATDLRPSMDDIVPSVGGGAEDDRVKWQHMTTFTIGLGVSGTLNYRSDYKTATTGDFADLRTGVKAWPLWPDPSLNYAGNKDNWNNAKSIDDFWHTAVNGRGQYFSAGNPTSVIAGLNGALAGINARLASGAGVGVSTHEPVAGNNAAYVTTYVTSDWTGDIKSQPVDITTGVIGTTTTWSAQSRLDGLTSAACDNRQVKLLRGNALVDFTWNTQACDSAGAPTGTPATALNSTEQAYFNSATAQLLSQWPQMTDGTGGTVDQRTPAAGANLVNFVRGQRGLEGFEANNVAKLYRSRKHVLGDIVSSQPLFVKAPFASYEDAGYDAFKTAYLARKPMIYAGGNDGMLHAFYAGTSDTDPDGGKEAWAVIPSAVLPNLFKLADNNYKNTHQYFVDGSPVAGDAYNSATGQWKSILVGGLNDGGKGYYALDITNPDTPVGLWEFKWSDTCYDGTAATAGADCHLGFTFGKPIISKLSDGTWVVMFTSGYNNVNATTKVGDGIGYLYVLNAFTGKIMYKIATGAGNAGTPSGLAQITNFVDNSVVNNTTLKVYGGDGLGNVWRFDVNDSIAPAGRDAVRIGTAKDSGGSPQPITTRPELAELNGKPMVFVGTGRLLGATDFSDAQQQSIYGIVDPSVGDPVYADLRAALKPMTLTQVGSGSTATRKVACSGTAAQCGVTTGWVIDLPLSGERVNVNMKLVLGTLVIASNIPDSSACTTGGFSWLNYVDFATGGAVVGDVVGQFLDNSLAAGVDITRNSTTGDTSAQTTGSDGSTKTTKVPVKSPVPTGKRISWREIAQ